MTYYIITTPDSEDEDVVAEISLLRSEKEAKEWVINTSEGQGTVYKLVPMCTNINMKPLSYPWRKL